jgi:spore maturation protein CgeB
MMTLGIGFASPSKVLTTLKTRDFECPGSGACYLTTFNWELALHYEIGKEILCYRSVEEIVELFSFYRRRPDECWRIAQSAYRRCINEHTWEKRFRKLFEEVGITSAI